MEYKFFPVVWNSDVTHQLRRYQIPTSMSLHRTNIQEEISGIRAILETHLVTSLKNVLKPIPIREILSS